MIELYVIMELQKVKKWAELNIHDYNTRQAFILITEIIYSETEDKVTEIEIYWNWFKEKWEECWDIVSKSYVFYITSLTKTLILFYNTWVKNNFCINTNLKKYDYYFKDVKDNTFYALERMIFCEETSDKFWAGTDVEKEFREFIDVRALKYFALNKS